MRTLFFTLLAIGSIVSFEVHSAQLQEINFDQLKSLYLQGKGIRALLSLEKCKRKFENISPLLPVPYPNSGELMAVDFTLEDATLTNKTTLSGFEQAITVSESRDYIIGIGEEYIPDPEKTTVLSNFELFSNDIVFYYIHSYREGYQSSVQYQCNWSDLTFSEKN